MKVSIVMVEFTYNEIENSRPLDVWRWSDFMEINSFVKEIYSKYYVDQYTRKDAQQRAKKHLKVLLIDLYVAYVDDPKMTVGIPMSPQAFSKGSRWRSIHIKSQMIGIVRHAETVGLIEIWKGNESQGRVSRVRPTKKLMKLFKKAQLEDHYWQLLTSYRPPIVFRQTDKKKNYTPQELTHLSADDMKYLSRSAAIITEYNAAIDNSYVDIPDLNTGKIKVSKPKKKLTYVHITQDKKHLHRVFNDLSIDSGGRFYGPFWQGLPEKDRHRLYIDDEPTVEIDYSGLHINLVYASLDNEERYSGKDPYAISLNQYKLSEENKRTLAKQLMLMALNASDERAAINAFKKWLIKEQKNRLGLPDLKDVTIRPIIEALKNKHKHMQNMFFSGAAKGLMALDSLILEYIIEECLKHNVTVLPVHDSIIVQRRYKEYAEQLMEDTYERIIKTPIGTKTSRNSYGLGSLRPQDYKQKTKRYKASLWRWKEGKAFSHYQKS